MTFGALAFVEFATAKNAARTIARSPGRLALWTLFALVAGVTVVARTIEARAHPDALAQIVSRPWALEMFGFFAALAGLNVALPAAGRLNSVFRSKAEARLLSCTGLPAQNIAVWLQIRSGTILAARYGLAFAYILMSGHDHWTSAGTLIGGLAAVAAATSIVGELPLLAFLLARRIGVLAVAAFGWIVAALGALYALAGLAQILDAPAVAQTLQRALRVDPTQATLWLLSGTPPALALALAAPLLLVAAVVPLAKGALPDLYAASVQTLDLIENNRFGRGSASVRAAARSAPAPRMPQHFFHGARTLLWSDWTTFVRTRGALAKWLALLFASATLGAFVLFSERFGIDRSEAGGILGGLWALALVIPLTTSISLADEIAKPIWWLAASALRERLALWSIAHAWRGGLALGLGPALLGAGSGDWALALGSFPVALLAWWFLIVLGIALYAAFPSKIDASGPAAMLRIVASFALLLPMLAAFITALFLLHAGGLAHAAPLAFAAAAAVAIVEALLLIEFATVRIGNNAVGLALLERSA